VYLNSPGKDSGVKGEMRKKKRSKIDINKIEEADYEEIKTPKQDN
jgi:ribosomal protein L20A (L18A)